MSIDAAGEASDIGHQAINDGGDDFGFESERASSSVAFTGNVSVVCFYRLRRRRRRHRRRLTHIVLTGVMRSLSEWHLIQTAAFYNSPVHNTTTRHARVR